jgi:hypothetical protein
MYVAVSKLDNLNVASIGKKIPLGKASLSKQQFLTCCTARALDDMSRKLQG